MMNFPELQEIMVNVNKNYEFISTSTIYGCTIFYNG